MSECRGLCVWCTGVQITLGLIALFMWLSLRPSAPSFSIANFYSPALNQTSPDFTYKTPLNTNISIDLEINNPNKDKGIYYDDINVTIGYGNQTRVGEVLVPGFYQGYKKNAEKQGLANATDGRFWDEILASVSRNETVSFRVGLVTAVRYKIVYQKTKHHRFNLSGIVMVDMEGKKSGKKGVKLSSDANPMVKSRRMVSIAVVCFLVFISDL